MNSLRNRTTISVQFGVDNQFSGKMIYRIERALIVNPVEVSVLDPTPAPSITLVTCYPFYFVGSAPQRCMIRAVRDDRRFSLSTN